MPYWDRIEPMPTPGALDRTQYEDVERLAEEQRRAAPQDKSKRKRVRRRNQHHIPRPVIVSLHIVSTSKSRSESDTRIIQ